MVTKTIAIDRLAEAKERGARYLLGPNGAGETTISHMAAGFVGPSRGEVEVIGKPA